MPLELEVALAYLRSRPSRLVSAVSMLAIGGIALGVAALVVAMGLLSGYRSEIREKLLGANAEIVVYPLLPVGSEDLAQLRRRLSRVGRVRATAAVVYQTGLAASVSTPEGVDAIVKGIDPAEEARVSPQMAAYLPDAGRLFGAAAGEPPGAAIGIELARKLGARVGDTITLSVPDAAPGQAHFVPRTARFRVGSIFRSNFAEYDAQWVFCGREALRSLARMPGEANVVEVKLDTTARLEAALAVIREAAGEKFSVADTLSMNRGLFSALKVQQITLFLVIGLIVGVSTFNLVATLVMTVRERQRDIGVLSALGAEPRFFSRAFLCLGAMLGGAGVVAGVAFGSLVCGLVTEFRLLSFPAGVAEIYFVSFIPFLVRPVDLLAIVGSSAAVILFVSWLTALRAARVDVAEALRYE
jgi:lipoprotein-releasing system permease protein